MSSSKHTPTLPKQRLYRRRDTAHVLGVSPSQVVKFERDGIIRAIRVNGDGVKGPRIVRNDADEVDALAQRWIEASKKESA